MFTSYFQDQVPRGSTRERLGSESLEPKDDLSHRGRVPSGLAFIRRLKVDDTRRVATEARDGEHAQQSHVGAGPCRDDVNPDGGTLPRVGQVDELIVHHLRAAD